MAALINQAIMYGDGVLQIPFTIQHFNNITSNHLLAETETHVLLQPQNDPKT